jgi:hypothetical protein
MPQCQERQAVGNAAYWDSFWGSVRQSTDPDRG